MPIAEETASKTFNSGHLKIALYTLDYGTHRDTLACFPGTEIANLILPDGELDVAMAAKAMEHATEQGEGAREEVLALAMWDNNADGMVPWIEPAAE